MENSSAVQWLVATDATSFYVLSALTKIQSIKNVKKIETLMHSVVGKAKINLEILDIIQEIKFHAQVSEVRFF